MDAGQIEKALEGLPVGPVRYFEQTGSTNDEAAHWVDEGAPDLALVIANEQRAGRGRLNRRWFTPPDSALAVSVILRPTSQTERSANILRITALASLALCGALQDEYRLQAEIKWPNDVLINGRKAAGILVEAQWDGEYPSAFILGIGVNASPAALPPEDELLFPAISVEEAAGYAVDRLRLLRALLAHMIHWRGLLHSQAFLQAWEARLAFRGERVRVWGAGLPVKNQTSAQEFLEAELLGLDERGGLRLRDDLGKVISIHSGEIRLRPAPPAKENL